MFKQSLCGEWQFRQSGTKEWHSAMVPGGVHTDLLALGLIPDPFVSDNEKRVQWVAETDWEYQCNFKIDRDLGDEDHKFLVCDGLDTLAEVTLNGQLLGKTDNMFRCWSWEVTGMLKEGNNDLTIVFRAPVTHIRSQQKERPLQGGGDIPGGPHLRKAPCQWGWDWGPMLPPIGIWKDIRLEGYQGARFADVHVRQKQSGKTATVSVQAMVKDWEKQELHLSALLTDPVGKTSTNQIQVSRDEVGELSIEVQNPRLWWPNGFGEQPLYRLEVELRAGDSILDRRAYQLGLRTIELRQEPDEWGESFTFVVNGVPIFVKGADWIPADSFPTRVTEKQLEYLIRSAAESHMNMLRVWGGGFYESETFYDLCDRYGILIWQDFIFACGIYPDDKAFEENVRVEAIENVRRLRHRACLALWCGNNEMEQGWVDWGWNKPSDPANQRLKAGYDRMFHHILPDVVASEDPDRRYWPSSASSGLPFSEPNGQQRGDTHYWDVWHGRKPFTAYRDQFPRFMSEFGFQALPPYPTIQTYAAPEDQNMTSYIMEHHQRSRNGNGLMISQMTDTFRMPKDFPSLVYLSMVLQAEGIRYGVEHWRRHRDRVSGTLIWQLNDCWPVASWSSVDYFGRWKALHYAAHRFYSPILLSVEDNGNEMRLYVTNDTTESWKGELRWSLENLDGGAIDQGSISVTSRALAVTHLRDFDFSKKLTEENRRQVVFNAELWQENQKMAGQLVPFVANKHLSLVDPQIKTRLELKNDLLSIHLEARSLARFVELVIAGADVIFDDNYFDLPAGRSTTITCKVPPTMTLEQIKKSFRVRSLYDSF